MKFSTAQFNKLSDITANIGLIAVSSTIVPVLMNQFDLNLFITGIAVSAYFWIFSLLLVK